MGLRAAEDSKSRFAAYVEGLTSVIGHAGPGGTAAGLLHGLGDAVRTQECGADGGGDGAGTSWGASSSCCACGGRWSGSGPRPWRMSGPAYGVFEETSSEPRPVL